MTEKYKYLFLTFWIICISGNPAVNIFGNEVSYVGTFLLLLILWLFKPIKPTRQDVMVVLAFLIFSFVHLFSFGVVVATATYGFLIKLFISLFAVRIIPNFTRQYISVMYMLSVISLVFFIPAWVGIDMQGLFGSIRLTLPLEPNQFHIGIHNFREESDAIRNMGMFWEPGAFAGYLILALFFMFRDGQEVFTRRGYFLITALVSTQSTTGYIALMIFLFFYWFSYGKFRLRLIKWLMLPIFGAVFLFVISFLFNQISFLGEKVNLQLDSAADFSDASRINRLGNFMYDLSWIADRPLFGWSVNPETRLSIDSEALDLAAGQGNGLTGFTVKFGLLGIALYLLLFAYNTQRISNSFQITLLGTLIVCVLLNGEQFLNFPLFLGLMFLSYSQPIGNPRLSTKGGGDRKIGLKIRGLD